MSINSHQRAVSTDVAQLKQNLDSWKLVLVPVNNILEWERTSDPILIVVLNSIIFGLMAYYNPSILTTLSVIGLTFLLLESLVPVIVSYFFKSTEWDAVTESKFTRICERISNLNRHFSNFKFKLDSIRKERQSLYFLIVFFFLVFCAYVGQSVDNFLLTYLASVIACLTPGIRQHHLIPKTIAHVKRTIGMGGASAGDDSQQQTQRSVKQNSENFASSSSYSSSSSFNAAQSTHLKQRFH